MVEKDSADFVVELFFKGTYTKGYSGYYKLWDKTGKEIYRSEEWNLQTYGTAAENGIVKRAIEKDLPKVLAELTGN